MARVSEIFRSIQGEGKYCGVTSIWVRFWGCSLQCRGFGQDHPTKPETWENQADLININEIKTLEDLPIFTKGCDSDYSVSKKFRDLCPNLSAEEVVDKITELSLTEYNNFLQSEQHLCFTGGEPMLKQKAMIDILTLLQERGKMPKNVTVETNGTREISVELYDFIQEHYSYKDTEWFWSVSPKLWTVAGEKQERAIKPGIVNGYMKASNHGQLKPVLGTKEEQWQELKVILNRFWNQGIVWPVYVMAVGATDEDQNKIAKEVCERAMNSGYNFSARVHCAVFGNEINR